MTDTTYTADAQTEVEDAPYGVIELDGVKYGIVRKPNTLLLSELARTGSGDPEALGVFAEFFEVTLGDNYRAFKKAMYRQEDEVLQAKLQEVVEKTLGRPTD